MVGVAGKSKACNTCRKRRVKCDLTKPACQRCLSSKRICAGYERETIFINRTQTCRSTTTASTLTDLRQASLNQHLPTTTRCKSELQSLFRRSKTDFGSFRTYAVELLRDLFLPEGMHPDINKGSSSWVYRLTDLERSSQSLDTSLYALCLAQFHVTQIDNVPLHSCLDQYNLGLQHLFSDLNDPEQRLQEETLAAILVMSSCEMFVCPNAKGWSVHVGGIAQIMRMRDVTIGPSQAWRHLFSRLRTVSMLEAFTTRQGRNLENKMWRELSSTTGSYDALDDVLERVVEIPSILEKISYLPTADNDVLLPHSRDLVHSLTVVINNIDVWQEDFWRTSLTPRCWLVPSKASNPSDIDEGDKLFPNCIEFQSMQVAIPLLMCWSTVLQMLSNILQVHDLLKTKLDEPIELGKLLSRNQVASTNGSGSPRSTHLTIGLSNIHQVHSIQQLRELATSLARLICQSMEYYHRIEMGTFGGCATTFQNWNARQYFRLHSGHERELRWLQALPQMAGSGTRWGLSLMRFNDIPEPLVGWS